MFFFAYLHRPPWDSGLTPPELLAFLQERAPGRALDLGCGTGTNAITLALRGWQVTGVDFIPSAIWQARRKARQAGVNVQFLIEDVVRLERLRDPYDLILDIGCFHSLSEDGKQRYLEQANRLLVPGGTWFLYAFLSEGTSPGISPTDIERMQRAFHLISRIEGVDHHKRLSAYFILQKN
ncbi:MAG: class I SAM-dependent methyltransferase [Anaerolineae bacterium]|nr:MAG: class I SAM-dependent methyltransferase [Anaerolineae bacterium]